MNVPESLRVFAIAVLLILCTSCARNGKFGQAKNDSGSNRVLIANGSEISQTPDGVMLAFEAIVINKPSENCIELFSPVEFQKYGGDPKWAISATPGFELGFFESLPSRSKAIVTGKYVFVRDVVDGPCGVTTGKLFEISGIEYR